MLLHPVHDAMLQSALHQHLDAVRRRHGQIGVHGQRQLAGRQLERESLVQPDERNLQEHVTTGGSLAAYQS